MAKRKRNQSNQNYKKLNHRQQEEERKRLADVRKRIRDHELRKAQKAIFDEMPAGFFIDKTEEEANFQKSDFSDETESLEQLSEDIIKEHNLLWVLEPEDIDELSLEDINTIWNDRTLYCGTVEAAAEVLALVELSQGKVEHYAGWQSYIDHPDIVQLVGVLPSLTSIDQVNVVANRHVDANSLDHLLYAIEGNGKKETVTEKTDADSVSKVHLANPDLISKEDVEDLSYDEIQSAWQDRFSVFASISAACEALSVIRFYSGIDKQKRDWKYFTDSEIIKPLYEFLDDDSLEDDSFEVEQDSKKNGLKDIGSELAVDSKDRKVGSITIRRGQSNFRERLENKFDSQCCITGCQTREVLEAAHIMPYMGEQSNLIDNGLLLRVDIHRLFDKFLISVNPEKMEVVVSQKAADDYRMLDGMLVKGYFSTLSKQFLGRHYASFNKLN